MENSTAPPPGDAPRMTFLGRLGAMYFEPTGLFEDVAHHGRWLGLYLIVAVLIVGALWAVSQRVDPETIARKQIEGSPFAKNIPPERMEEAVRGASSPARRYVSLGFAPLAVLVGYLVSAGALLLIFVVMGVPFTFKKVLPVTVWGMGPPTVVLMIAAIAIILMKSPDSIDVFNVPGNVASNLGPLADAKEHAVLHSALSSVDLFSFWTIYLLGLGFSIASRGSLTLRRAILAVMIPWGIYVAGKIGMAALWG